jgi:hypothetical protein
MLRKACILAPAPLEIVDEGDFSPIFPPDAPDVE